MAKSENEGPPHLALFPAAGMGHLIPFLRLAAALNTAGCTVIVITVEPTVSAVESNYLSNFFALFPQIKRLEFKLVPYEKSELTNDDPFFIQMERVGNSVHLLQPLLSSLSPYPSAVVVDFPVLSRIGRISMPLYTLITTSARFFSLMASLSHLNIGTQDHVNIPYLGPIPLTSIPPPMLDPNHFFAATINSSMASLSQLKGVLINTSSSFESRAVESLRRNGVQHILPIGPLQPFETSEALCPPWLDGQAPKTVVYINFGSRTALSRDQITELAAALELSECKFLWVLKGSKVDKEDTEDVKGMVSAAFLENTKAKGKVIKGWVEQEQILAHPSIGGFVSHCGWNSVTEAALLGVPILAWPTHGDQRVNAEVVQETGLGVWDKDWGWAGERLIGRDEIAEMLKALMRDERLRATAKEVKEKVLSSESFLEGVICSLKSK